MISNEMNGSLTNQQVSQGNYHGYYNKRGRPEEDSRLKIMQSDWFHHKVCLDIGCNDGQFTLQLAEHFQPRSILGIDLDPHLIESAKSRVKRIRYSLKQKEQQSAEGEGGRRAEVDELVGKGKTTSLARAFMPRNLALKRNTLTIASDSLLAFPDNATFAVKDVFSLSCHGDGRYDTVLCLSMTKWVHLNRGDQGLLELFGILQDLIKPSGRLILEYQPWKSYEKRRKNMAEALQAICIKPCEFEDVLTKQFSFELEHRLGPSEEEAVGFNRPVLVLRKVAQQVTGDKHGNESNEMIQREAKEDNKERVRDKKKRKRSS